MTSREGCILGAFHQGRCRISALAASQKRWHRRWKTVTSSKILYFFKLCRSKHKKFELSISGHSGRRLEEVCCERLKCTRVGSKQLRVEDDADRAYCCKVGINESKMIRQFKLTAGNRLCRLAWRRDAAAQRLQTPRLTWLH